LWQVTHLQANFFFTIGEFTYQLCETSVK